MVKRFLSRFFAASDVPVDPGPKSIKKGLQTVPSFLTSATPSDAPLSETDKRIANIDLNSLRTGTSTKSTINEFAKVSPDLSAAISAAIRMAVSNGYVVVARNLDGTLSEEGTRVVQQLVQKMDKLGPYSEGFNYTKTLRSNSEALARELLIYGSCSAELILDAARLPSSIDAVSTTKVKFKVKKNRLAPFQDVGGTEVNLDIPTYFYISLDQDLLTAYSDSPVQAALQPIIASQDFLNDLRRIFRKAIHPRQTVEVNEEKWRAGLSPDVKHDEVKLRAAQASLMSDLQTKMNGLSPEDALVYFDTLKMDLLNSGNISLSDEYKVMSNILNGKMSSGTKSMPVVLGHEAAGSTNIASTQSMLFVKTVEGAVQTKLNELYSRIFTLAIRLFGIDAIVDFQYKPIDLRPELELEAFKAMKQSRILEQLSLGLISDAEAAIELTGTLPVPGMPVLSGTRFMNSSSGTVSNPESNTSALNQTLKPSTPAEPKTRKSV